MAKKNDKPEKILKELNEKQRAFCREYVVDWNGARAYQKVYGCEYDTARTNSSRLLANANIKEYILTIQKNLEHLAGISRLRVLLEFMKIAFSNVSDFQETWVDKKEFDKLTEDEKACICEIKNEKIVGDGWDKEVVKVKLYDKQKALENISKMMGYNSPEEHNVNLVAQITGMKIK